MLMLIWLCIVFLILGYLVVFDLEYYRILWRGLALQDYRVVGGNEKQTSILIQIPVCNDLDALDGALECALKLRWNGIKVIQVLDDSHWVNLRRLDTIVKNRCEFCNGQTSILAIHRMSRDGFKAGALAHGLKFNDSDFVAILDVDFRPDPEWLQNTMQGFNDPRVGCVQTRWGHRNANTLFTRSIALLLDGHFIFEKPVRLLDKNLVIFNGSAGIWRRKCIDAIGGWWPQTLSEDADLSHRARRAGWRINYLEWVQCPAELPATFNVFRRQQMRWCTGGTQVAKRELSLLSKLIGRGSAFALLHNEMLWISTYLVRLILLLAGLPLAIALHSTMLLCLVLLFGTPNLAILPYYYAAGCIAQGQKNMLSAALALPFISLTVLPFGAWGVLKALIGKSSGHFVETPKELA